VERSSRLYLRRDWWRNQSPGLTGAFLTNAALALGDDLAASDADRSGSHPSEFFGAGATATSLKLLQAILQRSIQPMVWGTGAGHRPLAADIDCFGCPSAILQLPGAQVSGNRHLKLRDYQTKF
jgi:hypothetical protein